MTERRVVITGVGTVNALGVGSDSYFEAMLAGAIGVKRIAHFDPSGFPSQIGGESDEFKMNSLVPKAHRKATKLMSRDIELAVLAADYAVRDAGLTTKGTDPESDADIDPTRSGVNIGAGLISCDPLELGAATAHAVVDGNFDLPKWGREGMQSLTPLWLLKYLPNMLNCHISIIHDLQGPNNSLTCGEAAGVLAVGEAFRNIQHGKADMIIAGGAECKTNPMGLVRQCLMKRTSTGYNDRPAQASRPFDQDADGTVLGEGGGIMILEELEHARSRGARIYCELVGFGASSQFGPDLITPEPDGRGMTIAMNKALAESGLTAEAIDLLVPHGTGYPADDRAEVAAIKTVFGQAANRLSVLATKSRFGNCGAGAAAIDLVTAVLAMAHGKIPQTMNCPNPIAKELGLTVDGVVNKSIEAAMVSCHTYGGQTGTLVMRKI